MRILKRPPAGMSAPAPGPGDNGLSKDTLQEREAKYHAARERIFNSSADSQRGANDEIEDSTLKTQPSTASAPSNATILRHPRGPTSSTSELIGFFRREVSEEPKDQDFAM
jgi:hypothetical protein